jgi:transposase-like protein
LLPPGADVHSKPMMAVNEPGLLWRSAASMMSIAELCRRQGIAQGLYYKWSKEFPEAGNKRLSGALADRVS